MRFLYIDLIDLEIERSTDLWEFIISDTLISDKCTLVILEELLHLSMSQLLSNFQSSKVLSYSRDYDTFAGHTRLTIQCASTISKDVA